MMRTLPIDHTQLSRDVFHDLRDQCRTSLVGMKLVRGFEIDRFQSLDTGNEVVRLGYPLLAYAVVDPPYICVGCPPPTARQSA